MNQPLELLPDSVLFTISVGAWLCLIAWAFMVSRLISKKPVLPLEPRRQVPWNALDLFIVFVFFVMVSGVMFFVIEHILDPEIVKPVDGADAETTHAIVQLFRDGNPWTIMLCIISAVVVAPIVEEFLFRVLLQGWLERVDYNLGPILPGMRRFIPWGMSPIILSSAIFAVVHFRIASPPLNPLYLLYLLVGNCLVGIATAVFAALLIGIKNIAKPSDFGFVAKKIPQDTAIGLTAAAAVVLPIIVFQTVLTKILPIKSIATDPLPLFFFALALGFLYCRTHRIVASIVLHMSLNATSLIALWLMMQG
jgi:membrane protease YdiL (CAAX protease family)